jgi:3-phenylpropionate/trans-cinnamate dioxygenase ferredoxin subunit
VSEHDVGALNEFAVGEPTARTVGETLVIVVRTNDDVFVLEDRCSHEEFPLSAGEVDLETCEIECEKHGAMFSLKDGQPQSLPATKPVRTFPVRVDGERVIVEAP